MTDWDSNAFNNLLQLDFLQPREEVYDLTSIHYKRTYFSLITESDFTDGEIIRFTEKTIKAIYHMHPFLVLGNPYTIHHLRMMGFRIENTFFDTQYDSIPDCQERLEQVFDQFQFVLSLDEGQLKARLMESKDNLTHDYWYLRDGLDQWIYHNMYVNCKKVFLHLANTVTNN